MQKKCRKCGKSFEAKEPRFDTCFSCHSGQGNNVNLNQELLPMLLTGYFDRKGNLLREVFIDTPEKIARLLATRCIPNLSNKQLRDFHSAISKAYHKSILKGIDEVKPLLWQCRTDIKYQLKREMVPLEFVTFVEHHLALAEKDEKNLEGFYKHIDSIVCNFPLTKK